jgi:hypothetical protein
MCARTFALLFLSALLFAAGDAPIDRATLHGLKAVGVVIDRMEPALEQDAGTAATLRAEIEDRLDRAGIPVDRNAKEFLGLRLTSVRAKGTPVALCLALAMYQPVVLSRDSTIHTATGTWEVDTVLLSPLKMLRNGTRESLDELVDQFIQAYKSANPAAPAK